MKCIFSFLGIFFLLTPPIIAIETKATKIKEAPVDNRIEQAIFAMGCFWCGASAFANHDTNVKFKGISDIRVGYSGGENTQPTYENHSGHKEVVRITFDPATISYEKLLDIFWRNIDPFDRKGQFCDKCQSYTSAIYYLDASQKKQAEASKQKWAAKLKDKIVTEIFEAKPFYDAEEYHQNYKKKNPLRYKFYRWRCGRDARLKEVWKGQ